MKIFKYIIFALIIIWEIIIIGEIKINSIEFSNAGVSYICFESGDISEWTDFLKDMVLISERNNLEIYAFRTERENMRKGCAYFFEEGEKSRVEQQIGIKEGTYHAIFFGEMSIKILPLSYICEQQYVGTLRFYMIGDSKNVQSVYKYMDEKYGTSRIKRDDSQFYESIKMILLFCGMFMLFLLTILDISLQKKALCIRLFMGEEAIKTIIKNVIMDFVVYAFLIAIISAVLSIWISRELYFLDIVKWGTCIIILNSLLYVPMQFTDFKIAIAKHYQDMKVLFGCYLLQILVVVMLIFTFTQTYSCIVDNKEFIYQYREMLLIKEYSRINLKYYELTNNTSNEYYSLIDSIFSSGYDKYNIGFSVSCIDYDEEVYININDRANVLLHDIEGLDDINEAYKIHFLIPRKYEEKQDYYISNAIESGQCIFKSIKNMGYEIVYYEHANVLYFDEDLETNSKIAQDPIICYFTNFESGDYLLDRDTTINIAHEFRNILFDIDSIQKNELTIHLDLPAKGFYLMMDNVFDKYWTECNLIFREILSNVVISLLLSVANFMLIGLIARLEFIVKKDEIALRHIFGYGLLKTNKEMINSMAFSLMIGLLCNILATIVGGGVHISGFVIGGLVIGSGELIIIINVVHKVETVNISRVLNGKII